VPPNSVFGSAAFVTVKAYFSSFSTRRMIGYSFRGSPFEPGPFAVRDRDWSQSEDCCN
jgi:hypothetical protein